MQPEFPKDFIREGCPKVQHARRNRDERPEDFAECAFSPAGIGMMCENCHLHLTRPYMDNEVDRKYLKKIEQYYRDIDKWEREEEAKYIEPMPVNETEFDYI